ncbi:MAG: hypothetical protein LBT15_07440 [Synergistaceae bacterium]|jgi:hypothetical protein|nr:hypothetical protein [Synergistaceae bacterium]
MGFFEDVVEAARRVPDSAVERLTLGWHASSVVASDGRWGIGFIPSSLKEPHTARAPHTNMLLDGSLLQLAELFVSPFPQEFAAATAACAALLPFPDAGFRMDSIMPCARGDRVAVLGYEHELTPLMRDWGWKLAIFDDLRRAPDCFPQKEFADGVREADWVWLTPEAIRDRWLISTAEVLREKKGCFLQGPGLPCLTALFPPLGVTHLVVPEATGDGERVRAHIAAGGTLWLCPELEWRIHFAQT